MRRLMRAVERAHFRAVLRELATETLTFAPEDEQAVARIDQERGV